MIFENQTFLCIQCFCVALNFGRIFHHCCRYSFLISGVSFIYLFIYYFLLHNRWYQIKISMRWEDEEFELPGTPARVVQYEGMYVCIDSRVEVAFVCMVHVGLNCALFGYLLGTREHLCFLSWLIIFIHLLLLARLQPTNHALSIYACHCI